MFFFVCVLGGMVGRLSVLWVKCLFFVCVGWDGGKNVRFHYKLLLVTDGLTDSLTDGQN